MANIQEELNLTIKLLRTEWEEDLNEFKKKSLSKTILERKNEGICWYPVIINFNGAQKGYGDKIILEIIQTGGGYSHSFQSGKSVSLFSNDNKNNSPSQRISGVVNSVRGNKMTATFSVDRLPDWLNDGRLGVDLLFDETSYRVMEEALRNVYKSERGRLGELKQLLLGNGTPAFQERDHVLVGHLNEGQNEAVNLVLSAKDVAIIHGPPGTGKTTTLVAAIERSIKEYSQVLVCAPSNSAVDLLVEKLRESRLTTLRIGHPARVDDEILSQTLDAKIVQHDSYKDLKKLKKSAAECRNLALKFKRNFGPQERNRRKQLLEEASRFKNDAEDLEDYIRYDIFQKTQVFACTLVGAGASVLRGMKFPVVYMDEAAQGLEPAAWIPILNADKVVMAGDHCQLPPTIKSYVAAEEGLKETLFEKIIKRQNAASKMLWTQYRMPEMIMGFSSNYFYSGKLQAALNTKKHFLAAGEPVMEFIDTAGSGFTEQLEKDTFSLMNVEEARFTLEVMEKMLRRIDITNFVSGEWDIGIISPYRAQVEKIKNLLREAYELETFQSLEQALTIDTIDGFQGQERDFVAISLVRSNTKGEIGFLADTRRMNVALTRAKRKLLVIGDSSTLSAHPFYHAFLDYVEEHRLYKSVYDFIDF